jgi:hypothetical protein
MESSRADVSLDEHAAGCDRGGRISDVRLKSHVRPPP